MAENIENGNLETSSFQIEDLEKLLNKIGNLTDFDFSTLDKDDAVLSESELRVKEELEKNNNKVKFIEELIDQIKINSINKKNIDHKNQIKLIEEKYPDFLGGVIVTDTHIRAYNEEKGEYVISAKELKIKISKQGVEGSSYLEIMRYLKWIEHVEDNNTLTGELHNIFEKIIDGDIENSEYKKEIALLQKYLPKNFLENGSLKKFAEDYNLKINDFNIQRAYAAENEDETNEGELELIIDNLIDNLGETRAKELMQQCVRLGLNRKDSILFLSQYSTSLRAEIETYKKLEENKKYYEKKEQLENNINSNNKIGEHKINDSINPNNNPKYYFSSEDFVKTKGGFKITIPNGDQITISPEEKEQTIGNPEATENLINFYNFFKELNLLGVWKYRKKLMVAVGDININPNDGDSMKKSELLNFGNKLLTFIYNTENNGKRKNINLSNIDTVNEELRNFSGSNSILSDSKTFNIEGEDKFTAYLRNQGIIGGAYFKINKFRSLI